MASTGDLDIQASDIRLAYVFGRRFDLMVRASNALHAAACRREDLVLVILDKHLASAAYELGIHAMLLTPTHR